MKDNLRYVVHQNNSFLNHIVDSKWPVYLKRLFEIFLKDGFYYFVDYKTDAFNRRRGMSDEEIGKQLRNRYKIQMTYYKNTLETILNTEVKGYLYFFKYGQLSVDE